MSTGRFDPREGEDYGVCTDCGLKLATWDDAQQHMIATTPPTGGSHTVSGTNPTRESRIRSRVADAIEDAIRDALDDLQGDVDRGDLTEEEVATALTGWPEFAEAWDEDN